MRRQMPEVALVPAPSLRATQQQQMMLTMLVMRLAGHQSHHRHGSWCRMKTRSTIGIRIPVSRPGIHHVGLSTLILREAQVVVRSMKPEGNATGGAGAVTTGAGLVAITMATIAPVAGGGGRLTIMGTAVLHPLAVVRRAASQNGLRTRALIRKGRLASHRRPACHHMATHRQVRQCPGHHLTWVRLEHMGINHHRLIGWGEVMPLLHGRRPQLTTTRHQSEK
mmetsp:Transcript_156208/g.288066  ORF Transcript_156208/g.288066 Transcript_156208/m.288066 type:complete len:223 (+) Transcript_156208:574-1242(+)